ncbi:MAG: helix-turn-helix domain-containing protein [Vicinamibacterales bacterium]
METSGVRHNVVSNRRKNMTPMLPYDQLPEYLSPEEFRAYLRLSRNTVYELIRRREIPHVRFGRTIRIPKIALQQVKLSR